MIINLNKKSRYIKFSIVLLFITTITSCEQYELLEFENEEEEVEEIGATIENWKDYSDTITITLYPISGLLNSFFKRPPNQP
jgi:hypothetical protein